MYFPEKTVDPAWMNPDGYPQQDPFREVCPRHLLRALRVTDLDSRDELCTNTRIEAHHRWVINASRRAVRLLRHSGIDEGLPMDDGGWALLRHVASRVGVHPGVLIMIAATDDKGRTMRPAAGQRQQC
ncbi:MAG: RNA 2'-phosphotransferase [bacterium]|nr:RNA 2'-phosphotransferase [bacterium]